MDVQIQIPVASSAISATTYLLVRLIGRFAPIFAKHYPGFFSLVVEISLKVYYFGLKFISYFEIKNENENCESWSK
jgi:hypothetical protein